MITISDIQDLQHCEIFRYSGYKWVKDNVPGYSDYPGHSHMVDLPFPETKHFHYSDLKLINNLKTLFDSGEISDLFIVPDLLQFGDYDNSCMVERSNKKVFLEEYENSPIVYEVTGGYGSEGIALSIRELLNPDNEETAQSIIDCLNGLSDYPCLDDETMSNMENDAFEESLNDWGISDAISALSRKLNIIVNDYDQEKMFDILLSADRDLGYPSYVIESGGSCYIDIDRLISKLTLDDIKPALTDYEIEG